MADVCLFDASQHDIVLLVQEDKMALSSKDPFGAQVQLVVKAIAASNKNNASMEAAGLHPLAENVMPGIVMDGTRHITFVLQNPSYSDPVNPIYCPWHLSSEENHVTFCDPPLPDHVTVVMG
ncbi:hypothetical protein BC826DRAFT_966809 [Russula brevipes]|nr:hypothetical protein BC826DRAFT_966809 [Russula brevipes]